MLYQKIFKLIPRKHNKFNNIIYMIVDITDPYQTAQREMKKIITYLENTIGKKINNIWYYCL